MNRREAITCYVLLALTLAFTLIARATETLSGTWSIHPSGAADFVDLGFMTHSHGGFSSHSSDVPRSELHGLDFSKTAKQQVTFTINRDAGRFECEGALENGEGGGIFRFTADDSYAKQMKALGYSDIDTQKQFAMAEMDISLDFARKMRAENLKDLDTDKLIAFRIHGVTPQFIEALRRQGLAANDSDNLIAFRIHGVSPEFVEKVRGLGYDHLDADQLIAMRIHGVSPEYIAQMQARGLKNLSIDDLVSMRIHGID